MTHSLAMSLMFVLSICAAGCDRSGGTPPSPVYDAAVPPDIAYGRCWGMGADCRHDWNCGGSTCQQGICCDGDLDPVTCVCHCNGGPPCVTGTACCTSFYKADPEWNVLKCRKPDVCRGPL